MDEDRADAVAAADFATQIDKQVSAAIRIIGKMTARRDLSSPHGALECVFDAKANGRVSRGVVLNHQQQRNRLMPGQNFASPSNSELTQS